MAQKAAKEDRWVTSSCKMCLHGCGIRVRVVDGVVVKIEGDPTNPDNLGKLCPKGLSGIMRFYDPNRIKTPLKRTNPEKGPGVDPGWEPISWEEALDVVGKRLKKVRDEDPRKLLYAVGDFQRIHLWAWGAVFGSPNFFTQVGQYCGAAYHPVIGVVDGAFAAVNDYEYCNYWIQIGAGDGFSSHLHVAGSTKRMADARVNRGMKLIVVDPRLSPAAAKADEWIPILPGTDGAFVLGMVNVILHELNVYDAGFIKKHTNGPYLVRPDGHLYRDPETRKAMVWDPVDRRAKTYDDPTIKDFALEGNYPVGGVQCRPAFQVIKDTVKSHTPERMAKICTVPAATIRRIARQFVEEARIGSTITIEDKEYPYRPAAVNFYRGVTAHADGTMTHAAIKVLNFLVGNIDVPGGHLGVPLEWTMWWIEPGPDGMMKPQPHTLHPPLDFCYPPNSLQMLEYFPMGLDAAHLIAGNALHPERFNYNYRPEVMVIYHSNPLWNITETEKVEKLFRMMDFIVAIDIVVNESTEWADIILPDHSYLESTMLTWCEAPEVCGHALRQPVVKPMYDTRDAHDILNEITERCGFLKEWNGFLTSRLGLKPEYALEPNRKYGAEELMDRFAKSRYGDDHGLEWFKKNGHAVRKLKATEKYMPWEGLRIALYYNYFLEVGEQLKKNFEAVGIDWDVSSYVPVPVWREDHPLHRYPEEYDLYMIRYQDALMNFEENMTIPWIAEQTQRVPRLMGVLINSRTAREKGIKTGDKIKIQSPYGEVTGYARVGEEIHPRVIGVSNALSRWARHPVVPKTATHINRLLPGTLEFTDLASGAIEGTARVRISKIER